MKLNWGLLLPRKATRVALWGFLILFYSASAQELTLPVYHLSLDPADLDALLQNPWTDTPRPATFTFEDTDYPCEVRFRGATGRDLPKKSWKVYFDGEGPLGWEETNLNAEYRDRSIMRNALCMELTQQMGQPAPESRFISLIVNGEYWGVHHEIESVDDEFFDRRAMQMYSLFKALSHGCRFAPVLEPERLTEYYELKEAPRGSVDTLASRFVFLSHASRSEIEDHADEIVDIENVLSYFAVQFAVCNHDGYTKNNYVVEDYSGIYTLVPWDCDATLGNDWEGEFVTDPALIDMGLMVVQTLFQRLIAIEENRERFSQLLETTVTRGFDTLAVRAQQIYNLIQHDAYLDTMKRGSNAEFDDALSDLLSYLSARHNALTGLPLIPHFEVDDFQPTVDHIPAAGDPFFVSAYIEGDPREVVIIMRDALNEEHWSILEDNGLNGDQTAGDHRYSRELHFPEAVPPLYYCFRMKPLNYIGASYWPPAGDFNFHSIPMQLPVVDLSDARPLASNCEIEAAVRTQDEETHAVIIRNTSDHEVRLNGYVVRIGNSTRLGQIGRMPPLQPGRALVFTNHPAVIAPHFPDELIAGGLYFPVEVQDTVIMETPSGDYLMSRVIDNVELLQDVVGTVVINEINYNSADDFESGDWIELHAIGSGVALSDWILRDDDDEHAFEFPAEASIPANGYIVIAEEPEDFSERFPAVEHVYGPIDFGFSGSGDDVRLFNSEGVLVDAVTYDDAFPWPQEADGDGPTLELINPYMDNSIAESWRASRPSAPHGTPGAENSVYVSPEDTNTPTIVHDFRIVNAYPNPFNSEVRIEFLSPNSTKMTMRIYDILGRVTQTIHLQTSPGLQSAIWNGQTSEGALASTGIYFVRIGDQKSSALRKVVLLR